MKPRKEINGKFCVEPKIGQRAFVLLEDNRTMCTSMVVDVRNRTENSIEIETKNTIYIVTFSADSVPLAS